MTQAQLLTPLRIERAAVARGMRDPVHVSGRGPDGAPPRTGLPTVVAGVAGGLDPAVHPGDLVVADRIRCHDTEIRLPSAGPLAAALRAAGLTVHVGTVESADHVVTGAERDALAARGGLAVDTESAYLATKLDPQQLAIVRAVVDTADDPLLHPGTLRRGVAALRSLRRAAPVLQQWLDACGPRTVVRAEPQSFCAGVERAIEIVERALERHGAPVYVRRQIVHNTHVVADLERRGAVFVQELDEVPEGATAVLAAHGVAPSVRRQAIERRLHVIDATCPLVAKVHQEVRRFSGSGRTVFLIGHADHEEVVGTRGEAPDHVEVVGSVADARSVQVAHPERVSYVMQTTLSVEEADEIATVLRGRFPALQAPRRDDICYATSNRQHAVRQVAADTDLVLVVGSANSSNSMRLVEVARAAGTDAHLIEDASDLRLEWLTGVHRIGVSAGASAPPTLVDELIAALSAFGDIEVTRHGGVTETVQFTLPREVV
ncbi:4-hydroxy-3-methylbut-2-enyl diphosphate reductase [Flexivirga sp. ID2601S]|uniref:4-hydroxy-3-methylbut-2-enyl diphosphate reductase n=1 Tax=Flexivirga aerilata TaxID=1656889 RepID=A0A849ADC4_9MICO|nr:4-hydroxy-3-methylbut-2-enyl diphosphate reductase [Flexivirga aerilata]NNG38459.1 4-hydroxy-3-methylbut-2-enyl diphosphate reductase [Flexivirga aerilata]